MAAETHHDTYKSSGNHMPAHLSYLSTSVSKTRANNSIMYCWHRANGRYITGYSSLKKQMEIKKTRSCN